MEQADKVRLLGDGDAAIVLLQPADESELSALKTEYDAIAERTDTPFLLTAVPVSDWNRDLSPWPAPPVFGKVPFSGGADRFLANLTEAVLPAFSGRTLLLGGYSLAGLFALWAGSRSDRFTGVAAVSPSVWYPDWIAYASAHPPQAKQVYLSLGDREERAKNPVMATVGDCIRRQYAILSKQGVCSTLEWNEGNHFQNAALRTAAGFAWLIGQLRETEKRQ